MTITDLKTQILNLVKLQAVDSEIYALKHEKEAKPLEIKALQDQFEAKKQHLNELEKNQLELQKQRKDREGELAAKEEATKKLQSQLYSLKTNKEYQAMLGQIQDSKADGSVIEDKILQLFEAADKSRLEIDQEKNKLAGEEKVFNDLKKKVDDRVKEIDGRLSQLDAQRKQVLPEIEQKIMGQYDRILASRDGLAICGVKDNSCLGCNMFVPPQVINLIKMYDRIITCEICNRILYIPDESA